MKPSNAQLRLVHELANALARFHGEQPGDLGCFIQAAGMLTEAGPLKGIELNAENFLVEIDSDPPGLDTGPPSPCPDISKLDHEAAVEAMVKWFWENFEDPAESTPWDEGAYVYIWGGPYDAREELDSAFGSAATEQALDEAVSEIEADGYEWAPSSSRIQPEDDHSAPPDLTLPF